MALSARMPLADGEDDPQLWLRPSALLDLEDPKLRLRVHALTQLCKNEREKALAIYQQLAERRPHLLTAKRAIAGVYQEMGQFDKATQLYEDLIKANPNLYQSFQWELRSAYQRQGKGKELQKMEANLAAKARL